MNESFRVPVLRACAFPVLLAALLAAPAPAAAAAAADQCPTHEDSAPADLPNVSARLAPGRTLDILSIGIAPPPDGAALPSNGAAPAGAPRPPAARSFADYVGQVLRNAVAGAEIRLTALGGKGLTAAEMLDLMRVELAARPYQLVIWQTGTVEAVRNLSPGEFAATLTEGAELAQDARADLVLVDPQFSRFLQTNTNFDPYEQVFQQVAAIPGVTRFQRYDLTRTWVNEGQIDLERAPRGGRQQVIELLHRCLGQYLARLILGAGRS